jgi:hypothetical protein
METGEEPMIRGPIVRLSAALVATVLVIGAAPLASGAPAGSFHTPETARTVGVAPVLAPHLDSYEVRTLKRYARYLVEDIETADEYTADGIQAELALAELGDTFGRLLNAAVPPGANAAKYRARLSTLRSFAYEAADAYDYGDDRTGYAQYTVIRKNTAPILAAINKGLGTNYRMP